MRTPTAAAGVLALLLLGAAPGGPAAPPAAPADGPSLTPEERAWLDEHGPLRYVVGLEVPPTVFTGDDGKVRGIAIDLLNLMDVKLGIPHEVVRAPNQTAAVEMLRTGQGHLLGPITAAPEREGVLDYSAPFISGNLQFWVREDGPQRLEELAGQRVAVVGTGVSARWLREHHPASVPVPVNGTLEGLRLLARGEVRAYLGGIATAAYYLQTEDLPGILALGPPAELIDAGWAVRDGDAVAMALITKGMAAITPGERTQVFVKWTGYDLAPSAAASAFGLSDAQKALIGAAVALIVLLAVGTIVLRRRVASRTAELAEANRRLARDLELREEAERGLARSEAQLRTVYEASPVGIANLTAEGRFVAANPAFRRMLGYEDEEILRLGVADVVHPDDLPARLLLQHDLAEGRRDQGSLEERYLRKDGRVVWGGTEAAAVRGAGGDLQYVVALVVDLTDRRRAEEARLAALERVQEVQRLKEMEALRTRFISTTAHELNTPLTPILLQLEVLKTGRGGGLTEGQRRSLAILERNFVRLGRLIEDLLQAARLQAGKLSIRAQPVDLARLAAESVEAFQAAARQGGVRLAARLGPEVPVMADAARLTQVLDNLLSNALKFTPAGGEVDVEVAAEGAEAVVRVRDTGRGLRQEDIAKLFQPFSQLDGPEAGEGTGLGLYLSKGLVELHGGRIGCESGGEGKGSTFTVALPLLHAGPDGAASEATPREEAAPPA